MNSAVRFAEVTNGNRHILDQIADDVFDYAIVQHSLDAFLDDPRHILFVAVESETVIGMASAFEYFHPDKPPQLFINEVGVARHYRRRGIGRALVEALLEAGKSRGCTYAWLGTDADNASGKACFGSVPGVEDAQPFLLYAWALDEPEGTT